MQAERYLEETVREFRKLKELADKRGPAHPASLPWATGIASPSLVAVSAGFC
jgi:hypothetical protein